MRNSIMKEENNNEILPNQGMHPTPPRTNRVSARVMPVRYAIGGEKFNDARR